MIDRETIVVPDGARFVADLGGIAIWDVSDRLPKHPERRYRTRERPELNVAFVHHSGVLGAPGWRGIVASARYEIRHRGEDGWPGLAYHYWIPGRGEIDGKDRLVIYRAWPETVRTYHTGGRANDGIGVCLQGNTTERPLPGSQIECLEALLPYLGIGADDASRRELSWHSDSERYGGSGKPSCPGRHAEAWLEDYAARIAA